MAVSLDYLSLYSWLLLGDKIPLYISTIARSMPPLPRSSVKDLMSCCVSVSEPPFNCPPARHPSFVGDMFILYLVLPCLFPLLPFKRLFHSLPRLVAPLFNVIYGRLLFHFCIETIQFPQESPAL